MMLKRGIFTQRCVQRDKVGLGEERLEVDERHAELLHRQEAVVNGRVGR